MSPSSPRGRHDFAIALAGLLGIAAWELGGWDRSLSALFGGPAGFPLQHAWLTETLLHEGGRWAAAGLIVLLVVDAVRPLVAGPPRRERLLGVSILLATLLAVPALKRTSASSCPWDLQPFGGPYPWVPHWWPDVVDGGPGHCFPAGHAVAAFAFFAIPFAWRETRPTLARRWAWGVVVAGLVLGTAQLARGAHFMSHTLWSAWLCWSIAASAAAAGARLRRLSPVNRPGAGRTTIGGYEHVRRRTARAGERARRRPAARDGRPARGAGRQRVPRRRVSQRGADGRRAAARTA